MRHPMCHFGSRSLLRFSFNSLWSFGLRGLPGMFPSAAAAGTMGDLEAIKTFYAMDSNVWAAFIARAGDPGSDIRLLASLPPSAVAAACEVAALPDGSPLSAIQAAHVGLVYRLAKRILYQEGGGNWDQWEDVDPWQAQSPWTGSSPTPTPATLTGGVSSERKLKLSAVVDQADDSEFTIVEDHLKAKRYQRYIDVMGGPPEEECEPSLEQLSALHRKVFILQSPPYTDFGVFGPYGRRLLRSSKFKTFVLTPEGYTTKEIPGPANFAVWRASFRVFKTAMIMMDIISVANLMAYEGMIERFSITYPTAWHLVVMSEDNARAEHAMRLKTRLMAAALLHQRDPLRPWDYIYRLMIEDERYWREQLHTPALAWMAGGARGQPKTVSERMSLSYMKEGIDTTMHPKENTPGRSPTTSRKKKKFREESQNQKQSGGPYGGSAKSKGKGKSGKGPQLCYAWNDNTGLCGGLSPGSECKAQVKREHRCTKCKSPGHPAHECPTKKAWSNPTPTLQEKASKQAAVKMFQEVAKGSRPNAAGASGRRTLDGTARTPRWAQSDGGESLSPCKTTSLAGSSSFSTTLQDRRTPLANISKRGRKVASTWKSSP